MADSKSPQQSIVQRITIDQSDDLTLISIHLDKEPPFKKVFLQEHGQFLQLPIPNTIIAEPGKFIDGKGPVATKVVGYQIGEEKAMIRVFVKPKASDVIEVSEAEVLGSRIVLSINNKSPRLAAKPVQPVPILPAAPSADAASLILGEEGAEAAAGPTFGTSLLESLTSLELLALGLIVLVVGVLTYLTMRRMAMNRRFEADAQSPVRMRAISHLPLAPKQKVSLVEIGGERLLLSVSPDNITFLAKVGVEPGPSSPTRITPDEYQRRAIVLQKEAKKAADQKKLAQPEARRLSGKSEDKPARAKVQRKAGSPKQSVRPAKPSNVKKATPVSKKSVNVRIDDEGVVDESDVKSATSKAASDSKDSMKDVTEMIRERLKSLPKL